MFYRNLLEHELMPWHFDVSNHPDGIAFLWYQYTFPVAYWSFTKNTKYEYYTLIVKIWIYFFQSAYWQNARTTRKIFNNYSDYFWSFYLKEPSNVWNFPKHANASNRVYHGCMTVLRGFSIKITYFDTKIYNLIVTAVRHDVSTVKTTTSVKNLHAINSVEIFFRHTLCCCRQVVYIRVRELFYYVNGIRRRRDA